MKPYALLPAAVCAALTLVPIAASAHPSLQPREAKVGAPLRAAVVIPHGCDGSATVKLRVVIPEGVIGVKPQAKPGWEIATVRGPYARSYPPYHGKAVTEGVKEVIWTGRLADDLFDEFVLSGFLADALPAGQTLYFPTTQECEKGMANWTEIPAPGQDAHALASPAPGIRLLPAAQKTAGVRTFQAGALVIEQPWLRATPAGADTGAGYLRITNGGSTPERLLGGSLPGAKAVEVHEMTVSDGVMRMRQVEQGLEIAPGQTVELKPGGNHLMLTGLREGIKEGQTVQGSLQFEKAGSVNVEFTVAPVGAQAPGHAHH